MSLFYKNLQEQGIDFIADSLLHANDIFAKYATSSRNVASPSKLAGELLKSPTRTRTRSRDAASAMGRTRGAAVSHGDPFIDAVDVFDKENAPVPTRSSRSRTASTLEPQKGKRKAAVKAGKAIAEDAPQLPVARSTRKVLGDLNVQKHETDYPAQTAKATRNAVVKVTSSEDDSMAVDTSLHQVTPLDETAPRASTPPALASPPKPQPAQSSKRASQPQVIELIPIIDSDEDDSDDEQQALEATSASKSKPAASNEKHADPSVTSTVVSQLSSIDSTTVSSLSDSNDTMRSTDDRSKEHDSTLSGRHIDPKLDSARQAASLFVSKLQQQKDANADKPAKRTLASYGAKKSLSSATHNARPSNPTLTLHSASTPAGPGFRSSFLNKSLRKQIADQEALEDSDESDSDSDADADSHPLVAGSASAAISKKTAANTRANAGDATTKMAALPASGNAASKKRKSDEALPPASEAPLGSSAPPAKISKLGSAMQAAKAQSSAPIAAAKKPAAVGPASKLEQFRNNLAHVARSTGSGTNASSTSQPIPPAKPAPSAPVQAVVSSHADDRSETLTAGSDSSSEVTEKIANRSDGSTIKASAIPRSPTRSPSRTATASPVRLPPRTGSVRKSPRKLAEQSKASQIDSARSASPGPKSKDDASDKLASSSGLPTPRSPTTQPRSLAALFGSPKQSTKLPSLSSTAGGSTTPAHSPPKNWHGSRLPFAQPFATQQAALREKDKSLPQTPIEQKAEPVASEATDGRRVASAASIILSTSKADLDSQFFDARETTPEPVEVPAAPATARTSKDATSTATVNVASKAELKVATALASTTAPQTATKASGIVKASALSPKKVAAKALAKSGPTSPTKASALRAAANVASPSKAKAQSTTRTAAQSGVPAPSTSPSRTWGIGEKIKGFLGLHASTTTNPATSVAQTKISASGTFQPRPNGIPASTSSATVTESKTTSAPVAAAPAIPGALLASPTPSSKVPQVQSTPSGAAASGTANGKLSSIARAELLRKKQAEEEERKAKEKEERRRMLLAKKEERAKAMAEEELEKENRKRTRDQNERPGRVGQAGVGNEDASIASSSGAPAAIPAALLGGIVLGGGSTAPSSLHSGSTSSRTSAVSTISSGPPTRPSSALNGSYAGVKSRYMQTTVQQAQQPSQDESNKKRRVTNDRDGASVGAPLLVKPNPQPVAGARPGVSAATSQIGAPKMVRTVSQSSIRAGTATQVPAQQQQQQQQRAQPQPAPQQIKLAMKPTGAAAAAFGAAPRIPGAGAMAGNGAAMASMMAAGSKAPLAAAASQPPVKPMANANFSTANPFQQAKQQQLQMQMQKQKQMQMLQQQQQAQAHAAASASQAHAAAMREDELHRAAHQQFQMQNAAGGRAEEWDDHAGQADADEALPDIASEYSDSEDEETIQKRAAMPLWTQGDALDAALLAQSTVDADEIFGIPQGPVELEKILPGERTANRIRRPRTSSANWSGPDGLAQWEIDRYNKRMGIKGNGVQLANRDGSHHAPPPPAHLRMSMAHRQSSAASSSAATKKDDPRAKS
ncbi:uncharacterized protein PSANT_03283 [Moesziomyces antarcticus]|nr:uncharacterized protein PSANT_03283 [Moesziomyces antarcticus]